MKICRFLSSWRIALLCSFIYSHHFGQKKIMGQQFVASQERYNASREQASFAIQFSSVIFNLCGPIVGFMSSKFEMKNIVICGCFVASVSTAASFFAEDILFLTLWWGFPSAISSSMATHLLPSFLHFHFKTKKVMANGIAFAGAGLGGFLLNPFYKFLLDIYGMSGAYLILGAIALHSVPAAMLLDNPNPENKTKADLDTINKSNSASTGNLEENNHSAWKEVTDRTSEFCAFNKSITAIKIPTTDCESSSDNVIGRNSSEIAATEISNLKAEIGNAFNDTKTGNVEDELDTKHCGNINIPINITVAGLASNESSEINNYTKTQNDQTCLQRTDLEVFIPPNIERKLSQRRFHSDILLTNYSRDSEKKDIKELGPSKTIDIHLAGSNTHGDIIDTLPPGIRVSENQKTETPRKGTKNGESTDNRRSGNPNSVLYDPVFLLVSFITSSQMFILFVISTVLVDFSIDKGLNVDQGVYLLMCLTITDMGGRFSLGWVTDKGHVTITKFVAICFLIVALCIAIFAVTTNFFGVMICLAVAGVFMGALFAMFPVMMSEYFPGKRNGMALASRHILMVPASFAISPMIGYFRGFLGSYELMFYFVDFICLFSSVIALIVPTIEKLSRKETQNLYER